MKVLVTGGTGFIGSHVVRLLLDEGHDVRALVEPGAKTANIDVLDVERVEGDLRDGDVVKKALEGCRELYHLAAIYQLWLKRPALMYEVNVEGTRTLLGAALASKSLEKVVHTSSIAAVGKRPGREPADETTLFNLWDRANDYILSKYISELEVLDFVRRGLPAVIVNPAFPFGSGDIAPTPTGEIILNTVKRVVPGYMEGGFNAVDVEDVARGHLLASAKGHIGERYILAGHNVTYREFAKLVAEVAGIWIPDVKIPTAAIRAMVSTSERVSKLTGRKPLGTLKAFEYANQHVYFDNTKARRDLGLDVTPLRTAVEKAIDWFRSRRMV